MKTTETTNQSKGKAVLLGVGMAIAVFLVHLLNAYMPHNY